MLSHITRAMRTSLSTISNKLQTLNNTTYQAPTVLYGQIATTNAMTTLYDFTGADLYLYGWILSGTESSGATNDIHMYFDPDSGANFVLDRPQVPANEDFRYTFAPSSPIHITDPGDVKISLQPDVSCYVILLGYEA